MLIKKKDTLKIENQFVVNGLKEIQQFNIQSQVTWRHCRKAFNPADRSLVVFHFLNSSQQLFCFQVLPSSRLISSTSLKSSRGVQNVLDPPRYDWVFLLRVIAILRLRGKSYEHLYEGDS